MNIQPSTHSNWDNLFQPPFFLNNTEEEPNGVNDIALSVFKMGCSFTTSDPTPKSMGQSIEPTMFVNQFTLSQPASSDLNEDVNTLGTLIAPPPYFELDSYYANRVAEKIEQSTWEPLLAIHSILKNIEDQHVLKKSGCLLLCLFADKIRDVEEEHQVIFDFKNKTSLYLTFENRESYIPLSQFLTIQTFDTKILVWVLQQILHSDSFETLLPFCKKLANQVIEAQADSSDLSILHPLVIRLPKESQIHCFSLLAQDLRDALYNKKKVKNEICQLANQLGDRLFSDPDQASRELPLFFTHLFFTARSKSCTPLSLDIFANLLKETETAANRAQLHRATQQMTHRREGSLDDEKDSIKIFLFKEISSRLSSWTEKRSLITLFFRPPFTHPDPLLSFYHTLIEERNRSDNDQEKKVLINCIKNIEEFFCEIANHPTPAQEKRVMDFAAEPMLIERVTHCKNKDHLLSLLSLSPALNLEQLTGILDSHSPDNQEIWLKFTALYPDKKRALENMIIQDRRFAHLLPFIEQQALLDFQGNLSESAFNHMLYHWLDDLIQIILRADQQQQSLYFTYFKHSSDFIKVMQKMFETIGIDDSLNRFKLHLKTLSPLFNSALVEHTLFSDEHLLFILDIFSKQPSVAKRALSKISKECLLNKIEKDQELRKMCTVYISKEDPMSIYIKLLANEEITLSHAFINDEILIKRCVDNHVYTELCKRTKTDRLFLNLLHQLIKQKETLPFVLQVIDECGRENPSWTFRLPIKELEDLFLEILNHTLPQTDGFKHLLLKSSKVFTEAVNKYQDECFHHITSANDFTAFANQIRGLPSNRRFNHDRLLFNAWCSLNPRPFYPPITQLFPRLDHELKEMLIQEIGRLQTEHIENFMPYFDHELIIGLLDHPLDDHLQKNLVNATLKKNSTMDLNLQTSLFDWIHRHHYETEAVQFILSIHQKEKKRNKQLDVFLSSCKEKVDVTRLKSSELIMIYPSLMKSPDAHFYAINLASKKHEGIGLDQFFQDFIRLNLDTLDANLYPNLIHYLSPPTSPEDLEQSINILTSIFDNHPRLDDRPEREAFLYSIFNFLSAIPFDQSLITSKGVKELPNLLKLVLNAFSETIKLQNEALQLSNSERTSAYEYKMMQFLLNMLSQRESSARDGHLGSTFQSICESIVNVKQERTDCEGFLDDLYLHTLDRLGWDRQHMLEIIERVQDSKNMSTLFIKKMKVLNQEDVFAISQIAGLAILEVSFLRALILFKFNLRRQENGLSINTPPFAQGFCDQLAERELENWINIKLEESTWKESLKWTIKRVIELPNNIQIMTPNRLKKVFERLQEMINFNEINELECAKELTYTLAPVVEQAEEDKYIRDFYQYFSNLTKCKKILVIKSTWINLLLENAAL